MARAVDRIAAGGEILRTIPAPGTEFCDHPGCMEFAQSGDPTEANTLKFKCPRHAAAARARGETGERMAEARKSSVFSMMDPDKAMPAGFVLRPDTGRRTEKKVYEHNADGNTGPGATAAAAAAPAASRVKTPRPSRKPAGPSVKYSRYRRPVELVAESGEVEKRFACANEAGKFLLADASAVDKACRRPGRCAGRLVRFEDDKTWVAPPVRPRGGGGRPVEELDPAGHRIGFWRRYSQLARMMDVSPQVFAQNSRSPGIWEFKGHRFRWVEGWYQESTKPAAPAGPPAPPHMTTSNL